MLLPLMAQAQNVLTPQQQLEQAQKQLEAAQQAVEAAKKAKIEAEEAAKKAEENAKILEQTKALQEAAAKLNAEAEKIKAETQKKQAEQQKQQAEQQKQQAAEQAKQQAEQTKQQAEQAVKQEAKPATKTSGWEVPTATPVAKKVEKKVATNASGQTLKADPKYLDGAITYDENDKIAFTLTTDANGKSASQIYDIVYNYMNELTQGENNIASRMALVNKEQNVIANTMDEWLVFSNSFISLDRTEFKYTLVATIKDNSLQLTLNRINYNYEAGRSTGFKDVAENVICDKMALNKKKTALAKIYGKFRRCTIDRKDQIFNELTALVKQ